MLLKGNAVKERPMTAKRAIILECQGCCGSVRFREICTSPDCALNDAREFKSNLRRIKAHCIECNSQKTVHGLKDCGGEKCSLYLFREGKNPHRPKRVYSEAERQAIASRFRPVKGPLSGPESKNETRQVSEAVSGQKP
jgi:hypothetical protein